MPAKKASKKAAGEVPGKQATATSRRSAAGSAKSTAGAVRVYSWNVNGIRSAVSKGFVDWLASERAEIVGLQEVRAGLDAIPGELSGLTEGNSLASVHLRPAPVQITYLGYPNTTGLDTINTRIVDSITDPPGSELS